MKGLGWFMLMYGKIHHNIIIILQLELIKKQQQQQQKTHVDVKEHQHIKKETVWMFSLYVKLVGRM